jgi:ferredoxin-NADP reductase/ferredoxin
VAVGAPRLVFDGRHFEPGSASLLDCLVDNGVDVPSGCRAGVCQSCLMRLVRGSVPDQARQGLTAAQLARRLFLACQCFPTEDVEVALAEGAVERHAAELTGIRVLGEGIREVRLRPRSAFDYRGGQFVQFTAAGPALARAPRNYSLASVPGLDEDLLLHVARVPGGLVSGWIFDHARPGDAVVLSEARGNCFYTPGDPARDLLLMATGSGLAPLYAIARDALRQGHAGRIALFHGSRVASGLYLRAELAALAAAHPNFHYVPCVSDEPPGRGLWAGTPVDAALQAYPDLAGWRVYLCGNPQMVEAARLACFLGGAASAYIHADPFLATVGIKAAA